MKRSDELKIWLRKNGITAAGVGEALGINRSNLYNYISGRNKNARVESFLLKLGMPTHLKFPCKKRKRIVVERYNILQYDSPEDIQACQNCHLPDCYGKTHPACPIYKPQIIPTKRGLERARYLASLGYKSVEQAVLDLITDGMSVPAVRKLLKMQRDCQVTAVLKKYSLTSSQICDIKRGR